MLYVVATPIGNLGDISQRALNVLREVDFILCEDTRITKRLLERYQIKGKRLISYHQHTNLKKVESLIKLIITNKAALVTDAGTPGISDPGNKIIRELIDKYGDEKVKITPIPGPSAIITALSVSGFPTDKFLFLGFVPHKKGRNKFLQQVIESNYTVVFYESCYRIIKCLEQLNELVGVENKEFVICRELTKKFESIYRGKIDKVLEKVKNDPVKGEYVVLAH